MKWITADWVWAGERDLRLRHGVAVENGRIVDVRHIDEIPSGQPVESLDNALLCPGLINAHVHMDLGHLSDRVPSGLRFVDWILELIKLDPRHDPKVCRDSIRVAAESMRITGTTAAGNICGRIEHLEFCADLPLRIRAFMEAIAIEPWMWGDPRDALLSWIAANKDRVEEYLGFSPHAPYSVHRDVLEEVGTLSREWDVPIQVHASESAEELEYLQTGQGPFERYFHVLQKGEPFSGRAPGASPVRYLAKEGILRPGASIAHGNFLSGHDIETLATMRTSVVFCPRTHRYFEHPTHPVRELLASGISVGLGTDSLGSNPDYNLFREMAEVRNTYGIVADTVFSMATHHGAQILGFEDSGRLAPGMRADLAAATVPPNVDPPEVLDWVLSNPPNRVRTWLAGE